MQWRQGHEGRWEQEQAEAETPMSAAEPEPEPMVEDESAVAEAREELAKVVEWWGSAKCKDRCEYMQAYSREQRSKHADFVQHFGKELVTLVEGTDYTSRRRVADAIARVVIDSRPGMEPLPSSERGVFYSADVFASFIAACEALSADEMLLFEPMRPSVRLKRLYPKFNAKALESLREWEEHEYKRPARNAKGKELADDEGHPVKLRELEDALLHEPPEALQAVYGKVKGGSERELRCDHVRAQCAAAAKEMRKMNEKELEGELKPENRTGWHHEALEPIAKNTMGAESLLAAMKQVRKQMQTGAYCREKARVNARMSRCWETVEDFSDEEKIPARTKGLVHE